MEKQTFERALHKWDKWQESIEVSRKLLEYDPKWPKDVSIAWIQVHYTAIKKRAKAELERLALPPTLDQYWEDCMYSDYRARDGKIDYDMITRRLSENKSLPELPCESRIAWDERENVRSGLMRVEITLYSRFASKELFNYAATNAYETVKSFLWSENVQPHPVCQWLKGGRPQADESLALECVVLKDDEGLAYKELGLHYGWPLQKDSYGNLNLCSTARYYVKWGREIRKKNQQ